MSAKKTLGFSLPSFKDMLKKQESDILFDKIGGFGRYQKFQFFILSVLSMASIDILYFNFISYVPDHWCKTDVNDIQGHWLNGRENSTRDLIKNLTIPWDYEKEQFSSQCYMRSSLQLSFDNHHDNSTKNETNTVKCKEWEFDDTIFQDTIITRWQLVCDRRWMADILPTSQSFGILFGSFAAGFIADKFGRLRALIIFMLLKLASCILSMVAPLYPVLLISRFLIGVCGPGTYTIGFVLAMETTQPHHRTWIGIIIGLMYAVGSIFLAGFSYLVRNWRLVQLLAVVPTAFCTVVIICFLHESPRWLLQMGEMKKGVQILTKIGKANRRPFTETTETLLSYQQINLKQNTERGSPKILFTSPKLRKTTFVCLFAWCSVSFIYFALSLNANTLIGDIFLNFFFLSAVEIPANLLALLGLRSRTFGRRYTHVIAFLVAGIACFVSVPLLIVFGKSNVTTALAILGKAGITAAYSAIFIYTTELYPTEIRSWMMGICCVAAKLGSVLAPFAGETLMQFWIPLPSLIFGSMATACGFLMLLLPETRGRVLKDTAEEIEQDLSEEETSNEDWQLPCNLDV